MMLEFRKENENCNFEEMFDLCDCCGGEIRYGNAILEINRMVEQFNTDTENGSTTITVIDDAQLAVLCAYCANRLADRRMVLKRLVALLGLPGLTARATEGGCCNLCGAEMAAGMARVAVERRIAQVDSSPEYWGNSIITPIDAEDIFFFCADCGVGMSAERLGAAVQVLVGEVRLISTCCVGTEEPSVSLTERKLRMIDDAVRTVREIPE